MVVEIGLRAEMAAEIVAAADVLVAVVDVAADAEDVRVAEAVIAGAVGVRGAVGAADGTRPSLPRIPRINLALDKPKGTADNLRSLFVLAERPRAGSSDCFE